MSYYPSYTSGDWKALCMRCGRLFKGSQLQQTWDGLWVCKEDWEPKHTQLLVTGVKDDQRPPFVFHSNSVSVETYELSLNKSTFPSSDLETVEYLRLGQPSGKRSVGIVTGSIALTDSSNWYYPNNVQIVDNGIEIPCQSYLAGEGIQQQWCEPRAITRIEGTDTITYFGVVRNNGDQVIYRFNHTDHSVEDKTVLTTYGIDDHNIPSIQFTPAGKLIIGCTGHGNDEFWHYDVFDTWADVTTLTQTFDVSFIVASATATYAQIQTLEDRIYIWVRGDGEAVWYYAWSDDEGVTWSGLCRFLALSGKPYMLTRKAYDSKYQDHIRVMLYGHPTSSTTNAQNAIRMARLIISPVSGNQIYQFDEAGLHRDAISNATPSTPITNAYGDWIKLYEAPAGRRVRMWDVSDTEQISVLFTEFNLDSPYANPVNKILTYDTDGTINVYTLPVAGGDDLVPSGYTYYPGMGCRRQGDLTRVDYENITIARNTRSNGNYILANVVYNHQSNTAKNNLAESSGSQLARPYSSAGYGAEVVSHIDYYTDYNHYRSNIYISDPISVPVPPPPPYVWRGFYDTFTNVDGIDIVDRAPDLGVEWKKHIKASGRIIIESNTARAKSTTTSLYLAYPTPTTSNYFVSSNVYIRELGSQPGIVLRYEPFVDTGYIGRISTTANTWQILLSENGVQTLLANSNANITENSMHNLKLEAIGSNIRLYANGSVVASVNNSNVSNIGYPGIRTAGLTNISNSPGYDNLYSNVA